MREAGIPDTTGRTPAGTRRRVSARIVEGHMTADRPVVVVGAGPAGLAAARAAAERAPTILRDEVPILGPLPGLANIGIAAGFSGHGFQLSPIIGQVIAERVLDRRASVDIEPLGFQRLMEAIASSAQPGPKAG